MKKLFLIASLLLVGVVTFAQVSLVQPLRAGPSGADVLSDTVTNAGTSFLTSPAVKGNYSYVTIEVTVTKISGTVGGTISLLGAVNSSSSNTSAVPTGSAHYGSVSATTFSALKTIETQTAVATVTATDASAVYHWRVINNPFVRYRVTWTGAGTMAASFTAKVLAR